MTQTTKLTKEIFSTVYQWGRTGVVVDYRAPYFRKLVRQLLASKKV